MSKNPHNYEAVEYKANDADNCLEKVGDSQECEESDNSKGTTVGVVLKRKSWNMLVVFALMKKICSELCKTWP